MLREVAQATQGEHAGPIRDRRGAAAREWITVVDFVCIPLTPRTAPVGLSEYHEPQRAPCRCRVDRAAALPGHIIHPPAGCAGPLRRRHFS